MLFFIFFLVNTNLVLLNAQNDSSENTKYINSLPPSAKREFLKIVARRVIEEVNSNETNADIKSGEVVPEEHLNVHSEYVNKLIKEEIQKFESRRTNEKELEQDVEKQVENVSQIDDEEKLKVIGKESSNGTKEADDENEKNNTQSSDKNDESDVQFLDLVKESEKPSQDSQKNDTNANGGFDNIKKFNEEEEKATNQSQDFQSFSETESIPKYAVSNDFVANKNATKPMAKVTTGYTENTNEEVITMKTTTPALSISTIDTVETTYKNEATSTSSPKKIDVTTPNTPEIQEKLTTIKYPVLILNNTVVVIDKNHSDIFESPEIYEDDEKKDKNEYSSQTLSKVEDVIHKPPLVEKFETNESVVEKESSVQSSFKNESPDLNIPKPTVKAPVIATNHVQNKLSHLPKQPYVVSELLPEEVPFFNKMLLSQNSKPDKNLNPKLLQNQNLHTEHDQKSPEWVLGYYPEHDELESKQSPTIKHFSSFEDVFLIDGDGNKISQSDLDERVNYLTKHQHLRKPLKFKRKLSQVDEHDVELAKRWKLKIKESKNNTKKGSPNFKTNGKYADKSLTNSDNRFDVDYYFGIDSGRRSNRRKPPLILNSEMIRKKFPFLDSRNDGYTKFGPNLDEVKIINIINKNGQNLPRSRYLESQYKNQENTYRNTEDILGAYNLGNQQIGQVENVDNYEHIRSSNNETINEKSRNLVDLISQFIESQENYKREENSNDELFNVFYKQLQNEKHMLKSLKPTDLIQKPAQSNLAQKIVHQKPLKQKGRVIEPVVKFVEPNTKYGEFIEVMQDMIKQDHPALNNYDWLATTVDIRTALRKIKYLCDEIIDGAILHPKDLQVLKYIVYLYEVTQDRVIDSPNQDNESENVPPSDLRFIKSGKKQKVFSRRYNVIADNSKPWLSISGLKEKAKVLNEFAMDLEDALNDLHAAIKWIALRNRSTKSYFKYLKNMYLLDASAKHGLEIVLHLQTTAVLVSIEHSAQKGLADNYVRYAMSNTAEVDKTINDFSFLVELLEKLKKM